MNNLIMVALGGAVGATLRFGVVSGAQMLGLVYPLGTLLVNVIGSCLIGIAAAYWMLTGGVSSTTQLFFQTGVLGAFTTFSAFSLDTLTLWQNGYVRTAALNVVLNVCLCLIAIAAGMAVGSNLAR